MPKGYILIIDQKENVIEMARILKDSGFRVAGAVSVEQAQKAMQKFKPQMVITAERLPDKDGLELLQYIRQQTAMLGLPVITVFDDMAPERIRAFLKGGSSRYVMRSFLQANLVKTIREVQNALHFAS